MAWLESKGDVLRIRFRFGGAKHLLPLHSSDRREAEDALARFKGNLRLIERGMDITKPWITTGFLQAGLVDQDWVKARAAKATAVTDDMPVTEFPLDELLRGTPLVGPYSDVIPAEARTGK